jgi:hypothetical protein
MKRKIITVTEGKIPSSLIEAGNNWFSVSVVVACMPERSEYSIHIQQNRMTDERLRMCIVGSKYNSSVVEGTGSNNYQNVTKCVTKCEYLPYE